MSRSLDSQTTKITNDVKIQLCSWINRLCVIYIKTTKGNNDLFQAHILQLSSREFYLFESQ